MIYPQTLAQLLSLQRTDWLRRTLLWRLSWYPSDGLLPAPAPCPTHFLWSIDRWWGSLYSHLFHLSPTLEWPQPAATSGCLVHSCIPFTETVSDTSSCSTNIWITKKNHLKDVSVNKDICFEGCWIKLCMSSRSLNNNFSCNIVSL